MPAQRPHPQQDRTFEPREPQPGPDPLEPRRSSWSAAGSVVAVLALTAAVIVLIFAL